MLKNNNMLKKNAFIWFSEKKQPRTIGVVFSLMFIYGSLLLMVGYTNVGLNQITGLNGRETVWLAIPQSIALTVGTYCLKFFLKKFNIRTIFFCGYSLVLVCLILISQLDKISGATGTDPSTTTKHTALGLYIVFTFFLGLGLSPTSPINSIYLSTIFRGKKRGFFLSASNGVYGVGGGIIPLAAASAIYNLQNNGSAEFSTLRFFYYIAIGLAALAILIALVANYKQAEQTLTIKDMTDTVDKTVTKSTHKTFFVTAVILVVIMYIFYMLPETFSNYSFTNFVKGENADKARSITATQCFGLFLVVQGIWRCVSGFTVTRWFRFRTFLTYSVLFIIAGFAILASGLLNNNANWGFLVAVLIGLGFGNMWPIMFSYASAINNEKAAFMGVAINITSMAAIPVFQLLAGGLTNPRTEAIVALCSAVILLGMIWTLSTYLKRSGQPHVDDTRQHTFPLAKKTKETKTEQVA